MRWSTATARLPFACPVETLIEGDGKSLSIAAASIVAKVMRDRVMCALDLEYPGYNWARTRAMARATILRR